MSRLSYSPVNLGLMSMNKLDTMIAIKAEVFNIQERLNSTDAQVVKDAMEDYLMLADIFYSENEEMMAPQQYEAAKKDFEYFMRLVELAYHYFEDVEGRGTKPFHCSNESRCVNPYDRRFHSYHVMMLPKHLNIKT